METGAIWKEIKSLINIKPLHLLIIHILSVVYFLIYTSKKLFKTHLFSHKLGHQYGLITWLHYNNPFIIYCSENILVANTN